MRKWRIEDSMELYNINGWGLKYFTINDKGHVSVTPKEGGASVDLKELMDELQVRDVTAPVLVRFPDILDNRIEKISNCFRRAADEYGYTAQNFVIYPIKVNQMRQVVEEIVSHGKKFNIGLEAGSKPEPLHIHRRQGIRDLPRRIRLQLLLLFDMVSASGKHFDGSFDAFYECIYLLACIICGK